MKVRSNVAVSLFYGLFYWQLLQVEPAQEGLSELSVGLQQSLYSLQAESQWQPEGAVDPQ
jgi:hypothetical protein